MTVLLSARADLHHKDKDGADALKAAGGHKVILEKIMNAKVIEAEMEKSKNEFEDKLMKETVESAVVEDQGFRYDPGG